eukprot:213296-Hanusia_phi.AAC.2
MACRAIARAGPRQPSSFENREPGGARRPPRAGPAAGRHSVTGRRRGRRGKPGKLPSCIIGMDR